MKAEYIFLEVTNEMYMSYLAYLMDLMRLSNVKVEGVLQNHKVLTD